MQYLLELIKNTPAILKEAGATELTLAAFFFLLGVVGVVYLMKEAAPKWKLSALILWFAGSLVALLLVLDARAGEIGYLVRPVGQDTLANGTLLDLQLGYIAADSNFEVELQVLLEAGKGEFRISAPDAPISASWKSGFPEQVLSESEEGTLVIGVSGPPTEEAQVRQISIVPASGRRFGPLVLQVRYHPLPKTVVVNASSGPRPSGRGKDYSQIYSVCAPSPSVGDYVVAESREWLTGDRSCGSWARCVPRRDPAGKEACMDFSLQGHDECLGPFRNCAAVRDSEGHVSATFSLVSSAPILTTRKA